MPLRLYYCDHYPIPLPSGHKFPMRKYAMVRELLSAEGMFEFECAPLADAESIMLAHDPGYVRSFLSGTIAPSVIRRIGFPWSPELVKRTLASVGGTLKAASDAISTGFGGNLAGGTHHAFRAEGSGFCVFNDLAVAILWLRNRGMAKRAAVVDLDVHQGDGTAEIFENDDDVLTLSIHGRGNFPFRKRKSRIDVHLEDGTADDEYLEALAGVLPSVEAFKPDIVFYQSGVDALATDKLGRLSLTHAGLLRRDEAVLTMCRRLGVPVVITLGGGYSQPIEATVDAHANTFKTAARLLADRN